MKSISQMAEILQISSGTIREYLDRFNQFFPDPVEHKGVKEYPPETEELVRRIYNYYQNSGMTKEQIRVKLGGAAEAEENAGLPGQPGGGQGPVMDSEQFGQLNEKLDRLIQVIEQLTSQLAGVAPAGLAVETSAKGNHEKIKAINDQVTDILEMNQEDDQGKIEAGVKEADGTVIFSYGRIAPAALEAVKYCKEYAKPWIHIDLETEKRPAFAIRAWLRANKVKALNVAGKSASKVPGLKKTVNDMIATILNT